MFSGGSESRFLPTAGLIGGKIALQHRMAVSEPWHYFLQPQTFQRQWFCGTAHSFTETSQIVLVSQWPQTSLGDLGTAVIGRMLCREGRSPCQELATDLSVNFSSSTYMPPMIAIYSSLLPPLELLTKFGHSHRFYSSKNMVAWVLWSHSFSNLQQNLLSTRLMIARFLTD